MMVGELIDKLQPYRGRGDEIRFGVIEESLEGEHVTVEATFVDIVVEDDEPMIVLTWE